MILALLLALAAMQGGGRLGLVDETVSVPPGEWREIGFTLRQRGAEADCRFEVVSGRSGVRVILMRRSEIERLRARLPHKVLVSTGYDREGAFRFPLDTGDYGVVIDNQLEGREAAEVRLAIALSFIPPPGHAQELSSRRKGVVVAISLGTFAIIVLYAGWKLRGALLRRPPYQPPPFWM